MKTRYSYALALAGCSISFFAQAQAQASRAASSEYQEEKAVIVRRACGTMEALSTQLAADPAMAQRMAAIENFTQRFKANPLARRPGGGGTGTGTGTGTPPAGTVIIPVVVHVLYNTAAQNISDAQVQSQLDVLNEDYQKLNADNANTPGIYAGLVANVDVRFVLAARDPSGSATSGVVHKFTKTTSWSTNDAMKNSKRGGDNAWDASQYLNLWACNLGQGLLGYAQFPGGAASTDGVVILYSAFGSRTKYAAGTYINSYDLGRTATHEVGHWLNLRHIWGDDSGACTGSDLVDDTPNQAGENYGCPTFPHVSCANTGDMSMNYMDYVNDACMYMFSTGQSTRMNALFASGGARASLVSSLGGTAPRAAASSTQVSFYPNPASEVLTLDLPAGARTADYSVRIYDMTGHEMRQVRYDGRGQVRVSELPKGLYYVAIGTGAELTRVRFEKQ